MWSSTTGFNGGTPSLPSDRFRLTLWIAWDQWAACARRGISIEKDVNPVGDLFIEFVSAHQAVDLRGAEQWPMVLPTLQASIAKDK